MKIPLILLVIIIVFAESTNAQDVDKRIHIGIGVGPSFLPGVNERDSLGGTPGVGLNLHLLDAAYTLGKRISITFSWQGGAHIFHTTAYRPVTIGDPILTAGKHTIRYGLLAIGPMYSFKITTQSFLDLKARVGRFYAGDKFQGNNGTIDNNTWSLGYSIGAAYRLAFTKHWYASASAEYASGKFNALGHNLNVINLNVGIGVQF